MDKQKIIDNAPTEATHYAVNKSTKETRYVTAKDSDYLVLPLTRFSVVLAYKCWDVYLIEDMKK